jgi:hypothetical protein
LDSFPCPTEESNGDIIKHIYVQWHKFWSCNVFISFEEHNFSD